MAFFNKGGDLPSKRKRPTLDLAYEYRKRLAVGVLSRVLRMTCAAFYKRLGRKPSPAPKTQNLVVSEAKHIRGLARHQDNSVKLFKPAAQLPQHQFLHEMLTHDH